MSVTKRSSNKRFKRGLALITTLLVITLISMLLGAFFTANRAQVSVLKSSQQSERFQRSAFSIASFLQSRLEDNVAWPEGSEAGENSIEGVMSNLTWTKVDDRVYAVTGDFLPGKTSFSGLIHNNLDNEATLEVGAGAAGVPPESCRIFLETAALGSYSFKGPLGANKSQAFTFRKAAYIDSTMVASEGIYIDTNQVIFDSKDEIRNQIRSLKDVNFATLENLGFGNTESSAPGVVWARDEIYAQGERINDAIRKNTLTAAKEKEGTVLERELNLGRFMENAVGEFTKPDFDINDVKGAGANSEVSRPKVVIKQGVYEFSKVDYLEYSGDGYTRATQDILIHRASSEPGSEILGVYAQKDALGGANRTNRFALGTGLGEITLGGTPITRLGDKDGLGNNFTLPVDSGADNAPMVDFNKRTITFAEGVDYEVNGNFGVTTNVVHGYRASIAGDSLTQTPNLLLAGDSKPKLVLGAANSKKNKDGSDSGADESRRAYLSVSGDMDVNGSIEGYGNIVVGTEGKGGDITFELNKADLRADEKTDFAVFSEGSILVRGTGQNNKEVNFKGLLYAQENVVFDFSGDDLGEVDYSDLKSMLPSARKRGTLNVEGSVVAENGHLAVRGVDKARFTYEPKYLDNLFVTSSQKMRLEPLAWWPR